MSAANRLMSCYSAAERMAKKKELANRKIEFGFNGHRYKVVRKNDFEVILENERGEQENFTHQEFEWIIGQSKN